MKRLFLFFLIIILISKISLLTSCANIIPPQGGPKDSLPPLLLKVNPKDSAKNSTEKKISFTFDEFVELDNVRENLIVSPTYKIQPEVTSKLNIVTVKIKDTLEKNTTYSFNFGNAIKDVNEGNVLKQFTYVFSTGPYIDSLEIHGKVILAETGKPDSSLIVMLHTNSSDSALAKEKPRYITRLDSKGNFVFKNLPHSTFYLYALQDESGIHRYDGNEKVTFAFADKPVTTGAGNEPDTLYAFGGKESNASKNTSGVNPTAGRNKPSNNAADKRLKYLTNVQNNQQDLLGSFIITFEQPLRLFDSTKIRLYTDSTYKPVTDYKFEKDSSNRKLQLVNTWKENTTYHIIVDKEFADDSSGRKLLKTDTLHFKTRKLSEYGKLKLTFHGLDLKKNPVLQFVSNNAVVRSFPLSSAILTQALFLPGEYELRILFDANKNGVWDSGEFFGKHKQPEIVMPVERKITVKMNWENEFEIAL